MLHGVPSSGLLFRGAMPLLAQAGFRVLAPDLPGYGESDAIADLSVGGHLAWLLRWLDHVGVDRCAVAGVDFGGLVAAELCLAGRGTRLVLTSSALSWGWATSVAAAIPPFDRLFYRLFSGHLYLRRAENPGPLVALHAGRIESDPDFIERMRGTALALRPSDRAARLDVPVRLVWGSEDPLFPPWMARRLAAACGGELVVVEGARHTLPWDRPAVWAREVLEGVRG